MILITGGTGFIGQALARHLAEANYPMRLLIHPSQESPALPRSVPVEIAVTSLDDERGLRSAMSGVNVVYHLISGEQQGIRANLQQSDSQSSLAIAQAAADSHVKRIFYVSHLDAERASAYPVLKAKGIAEEHIRRCGVDYTILRTGVVYGRGDHFTSGLAKLLYALPFFFIIPGNGRNTLQPLWVEDLATCLTWSLEEDNTRNQVFEIGGPEYISFNQVLRIIMTTLGIRRKPIHITPAYLRLPTNLLNLILPGLPISAFWLDYLGFNRSCKLDTLPRIFQLIPSRFAQRLDYLQTENWRRLLWKNLLRRSRQH